MTSKVSLCHNSSTMTIGESEAFKNWLTKKDQQKFKDDQLKLCERNRQIIEDRLEAEKRRIFSETCYWRWLEKKKKELKDRKQLKLEEERRKKDFESCERNTEQAFVKFKYDEWLMRKQIESNKKKKEAVHTLQKKESDNEFKQREKRQAEMVWNTWVRQKINQKREERIKKLQEEEAKKRELEEKRTASDSKFNQWLKKSANRPKPVRSNLGFQSLTCTNIGYINPIPWENALENKKTIGDSIDNEKLLVLYKKPSGSNISSNRSSTTVLPPEDERWHCHRRTADWIKDVSANDTTGAPETVKSKRKLMRNVNGVITPATSDSKAALKLCRNISAPNFTRDNNANKNI